MYENVTSDPSQLSTNPFFGRRTTYVSVQDLLWWDSDDDLLLFTTIYYLYISLEAKHLILVWIMKVKGPKNQADFIEVLYVVVNA